MNRVKHPEGDKLIFTNRLEVEHLDLLDQTKYSPSLFQRLLEKTVDIRVTVIGKKVFAVAIDSQSTVETRIDWRRGDSTNLRHTVLELPPDIESKCLQLVSTLGLNFGAIDLVLAPNGDYYFLEINPNGQWAWIEQLTGLPLTEALVDLLAEGGKSGAFKAR
jgi:glutathione synthase/RimK-type ligase-like ATP-grasp enzyme